jgi:anaerobic selenocysteine-containing dehydrogenase
VERVEELQFQRPSAEVELSRADAERRGIKTGDEVTLTGGGASVTLRARVSKQLREGVARVAREHAGDVRGTVEVETTVTA